MGSETTFTLEADIWGECLNRPVGGNGAQKQKLHEEE